jgi:hypothetical protein
VTWRELIGIGLLIAGLLGKVLGHAAGSSFQAVATIVLRQDCFSFLRERMRRGLGRPSLAKMKEEQFKDPPIPMVTDWICPRCHERNPVSFEICWKCEHSGSGGATSNNAWSGDEE